LIALVSREGSLNPDADIVGMLLERVADPNVTDTDGAEPLIFMRGRIPCGA